MIWLWLAFVVMLASFGCWLCLFWFAEDGEQPIRELDGIDWISDKEYRVDG